MIAVRLTQTAALRRHANVLLTTTAASSAALSGSRRGVSSQPSLLGLASTAKEALSLTARAAATRRARPAIAKPIPPLWTLFRNNNDNSSSTQSKVVAGGVKPMAVTRDSFLARATAAATSGSFSSAVIVSVFTVDGSEKGCGAGALRTARRHHATMGFSGSAAFGRPTRALLSPKQQGNSHNALQGVNQVDRYREEQEEERREEQQQEEDPFNRSSGPGYLPFPPPFHTVNIVMVLFVANVLCYLAMNFGSDDLRDFIVQHFTLSHENFHRVYPVFTNAFYQENMLQLLIDCWLLWQFGDTMLAFLGNVRLTFFAALCTLGGSLIHVARQKFELHYGMDELEVRGRCYGPNPMIMGLISMEGLIFRHLNFIQQPPVPFLVLTAFVMVIDVWRIFTTKPEEHGAATGGALMAYLFWALPTRFLGLDKLTATM